MKIESKPFGTLKDGRPVEAWILTGKGGVTLEVLTLGGAVRALHTPDKGGVLADVVLGYDTVGEYEQDVYFMGVTAGRVAGRISAGKLKFNDQQYDLPINDSPNHLHGGSAGFHTRLWTAQPIQNSDGSVALELSYTSPAGEGGYPGEVCAKVTYTITAENAFIYETEVTASEVTPVALTHHAYFNLAGAGRGTIQDHLLQIHSDASFSCDESMTLLDTLISVEGRAADFRSSSLIREKVQSLWQEHGDFYWIGRSEELKPVAELHHPESGRTLTVSSTNTCLQAYFSAALSEVYGKEGAKYDKFGSLCLECQGYPQAFTGDEFGSILVSPESPQYHKTIYQFDFKRV